MAARVFFCPAFAPSGLRRDRSARPSPLRGFGGTGPFLVSQCRCDKPGTRQVRYAGLPAVAHALKCTRSEGWRTCPAVAPKGRRPGGPVPPKPRAGRTCPAVAPKGRRRKRLRVELSPPAQRGKQPVLKTGRATGP